MGCYDTFLSRSLFRSILLLYNKAMIHTVKIIFSLLILLCSFHLFSAENIYADGTVKILNLQGSDGFDGENGKNAYPPDCSSGNIIQGRKGDNGSDGENGSDGLDAKIIFSAYEDLKNITLDQTGGMGGAGGQGGLGSFGCNGGLFGAIGENGVDGDAGNFGKIYLIPASSNYKKEQVSKVILLSDFYKTPLIFTKNIWDAFEGAKELFHKNSKISNQYYTFNHTESYTINLKWPERYSLDQYSSAKIAIALKDNKIVLNSLNGPIFDYGIIIDGNNITIEIDNVVSETSLTHLSLGKLRRYGEELYLEVKEKYNPYIHVDTKFVVSLIAINEDTGKSENLGHFAIDRSIVNKDERDFILNIGMLNFPSKYKRINTKLKIHVSVYRKTRGQTRILSLRGLFRI